MVTWQLPFLSAGSYRITATVDPDDLIPEPHWSNNEAFDVVEVSGQ